MIPFFRKIRKNLANDNRPIQYIRYAIGEIVLVVIGILIALQINTWNEDRKFNNLKKVYLERLIDDLKQDTTQINLLIAKCNKKQLIIETVINNLDKGANSDSLLNSIKEYLRFGWNMDDFTPSSNTYSDLSQTGNMNVFRNAELTEQIKKYYIAIEDANKGQNINKDWIIPMDVTIAQETAAFEFDPITAHLFKTEDQHKALQNLIDEKDLFKRNAAGHYWFNNSLKINSIVVKGLAIELINTLQAELEEN